MAYVSVKGAQSEAVILPFQTYTFKFLSKNSKINRAIILIKYTLIITDKLVSAYQFYINISPTGLRF